MPVFLIPFSVFFVCCCAQFFFIDRVKRALSARHPDVLQGLLGRSFFSLSSNALIRFAWQRRDLSLNDPDLTKCVKQLKLLLFVAYGSWGLCALAVLSGAALQPLSLDWLLGHAASPPVHAQSQAVGAERHLTGAGMTPAFGLVFAAAFIGNAIYLLLAWRLSARWNSVPLGAMVTAGDPLAVLGVIWWSRPATHDEAFLRQRMVTRTIFVLALAGTLAVFVLAFSALR